MKKVQRKKMDAENAAAAKKSSGRVPAANNCSDDDDHDVPLAKAFAANDTNKPASSQAPPEKDPAAKTTPPEAEPAKERSDADLKNGQSVEELSEEASPAQKGKLRNNGKTAKKAPPVTPKKRKASSAKSETENEDSSTPSKKSKKSNKKESKPVEEEFEVQSIVGHKKEGGISYYLVRWKGYTAADDTWEPEQDLNCPELVEKFKRNEGSPANGKGGGGAGKKAATATLKVHVKKASPKAPKKVDPNKEWEVEKIIDYSLDKGERLFRIRWKGFAAKHDTWEPESNLNCAEIIKKFMDRMDAQDNVSVKELREEPKKVRRLVNEMPRQYGPSNSERKSKRSVAKQRIYYGDSD